MMAFFASMTLPEWRVSGWPYPCVWYMIHGYDGRYFITSWKL